MSYVVHLGDCRDVMATLDDCSVDAIVTDPPYELGFMGKAWDASGIAYDVAVWREALRVLKPGGHLIAFGGSRTYHRLAVAIEDAGFEIRDQIQWIYGSGFPKSLDVSKAMDKQAGAERTVVTEKREDMFGEYEMEISYQVPDAAKVNPHFITADTNRKQTGNYSKSYNITAPATDLAKRWHGWGTALKPAHEPAVLARKPLRGTVADNVTAWGTGALNIDGTRVAHDEPEKRTQRNGPKFDGVTMHYYEHKDGGENQLASANPAGRWPSNVILDEEAAQILDAQSGRSVSSAGNRGLQHSGRHGGIADGGNLKDGTASIRGHSDSGGASRFFYVAKASKAEREAGLHYEEWHPAGVMEGRQDGSLGAVTAPRANHHPTVKPLALMRYLIRMVTPPGGVVLDPFTGSGSTGCAAVSEGFDFIGMDITPEYVEIAQKRIAWHAVETVLRGKWGK